MSQKTNRPCQVCGKPSTRTIATDKGECNLCADHYETVWNVIPNKLVQDTIQHARELGINPITFAQDVAKALWEILNKESKP